MPPPALPPLDIDLDDLIVALTWGDEYMSSSHSLDTQTGAVIFVSDGVDDEDLPPDFEDNPRYRCIDPIDSDEAWQIMDDFVTELADRGLARRLASALNGRKPFRRFKDVLTEYPAQREAWFAFERRALEVVAKRWCEDAGFAPHWTGRGRSIG